MRPASRQFGPYLCHERIGSNAQSALFHAIHEDTGQKVALRVMNITVPDVDAALKHCKEQLALIEQIDAPHTTHIIGYGSDGDVLYIALELMDRGSLRERMDARHFGSGDSAPQLPSLSEVCQLTEQAASALDAIHKHGITHGQLEPRTILFDKVGDVHLAEVGFTRLVKILFRLDSTNSFNMTRYSPPELWNGERPSAATDQYALACIVYELLTGQPPFRAGSIVGLMKAHSDDVAAPPHHIRSDLPKDLAMVFWQALAKPTHRRFKSAGAFYENLAGALGDAANDQTTGFFTFTLPE